MLILVSRTFFEAATAETIQQLNVLRQDQHFVVAYSQENSDESTLFNYDFDISLLTNPLQEKAKTLIDECVAKGIAIDSVIVIGNSGERPFIFDGITVEYHAQLDHFIQPIQAADVVALPAAPPPPEADSGAESGNDSSNDSSDGSSDGSSDESDEDDDDDEDAATNAFEVQTLYREMQEHLTPATIGTDDLNRYFTYDQATVISEHQSALMTYEASIKPLENPSLLDNFYRHYKNSHIIQSLLVHWLRTIKAPLFNTAGNIPPSVCNFNTRDKLMDLPADSRFNLRELILELCPTDVSHGKIADMLVGVINDTAFAAVLQTETSAIRWYIMDHILAEAAAKSSPAESATYLTAQLEESSLITKVLESSHLQYLRTKLAEYSAAGSLWRHLKWNRHAMPQKPDSIIDRTHKMPSSTNKTLLMIDLLTAISAAKLEGKCHDIQTSKALIRLPAIDRENLALAKISEVQLDATTQAVNKQNGMAINTPNYYSYQSNELLAAINDTAFARVIGDKVAIVQEEITRLQRMEWIETHRALLTGYRYALPEDTQYGAFIRRQVSELNSLIQEKLDWYVTGPWARKSDADVKSEISGLEKIRTALVNLDFIPTAAAAADTATDPAFIAALTEAINTVKTENPTCFGKHGNLAFFSSVGIIGSSKAEAFTQKLLADAQTLRTVYTAMAVNYK